jgi:glyoxylase-like metal-dependent hydrolase (beta-lactamase superfamily II)
MRLRVLPIGPLQTNCYLVWQEGASRAFVIDPGGEIEPVIAALAQEGLQAALIVCTHGHGDHILGAAALRRRTGAPIAISPADAPMLTDPEVSGAALFGLDQEACSPDRLVHEGERLELDGLILTVLETPGHTPGGISLLAETAIFVGDCLFAGGIGRTDLSGSSDKQMVASLRRLVALPGKLTVYPGHGPATTIAAELDSNPWLQAL